jgi:dTDP-glucose 4,6-dehydratase
MNLRGKSILVTGAGGFIGSHLVERLVKIGGAVRCFVRYNSRSEWGFIDILPTQIRERIEVIPGDLKDADSARHAVEDVDVIFHLGALVSIPYSYIHPRETIETNMIGTLNILTAAKDANVEKIVHASTSEVYGTARYVPMDENHPLQAQSPYAASKIGADKVAESFYLSYGLPITIFRPFNTYGPRQSARAVIPTIITQALTKQKVFLGNLYPTRDFTYVDDTVNGFVLAAKSPQSVGETINIGSGVEISILELSEKIISLIEKDVKIISDKSRGRPPKSEIERLCADTKKAKKILGWRPKISFEEGMKMTIDWISKNLDFYKPEIYQV